MRLPIIQLFSDQKTTYIFQEKYCNVGKTTSFCLRVQKFAFLCQSAKISNISIRKNIVTWYYGVVSMFYRAQNNSGQGAMATKMLKQQSVECI